MPVRINRYARGLLSFFDSKSAQQPPQILADEIRCVADLTRFVAAGAADIQPWSVTLFTGTGWAGSTLICPQNETWLILNCSFQVNLLATAGDIFGGRIGIRGPSGGPILFISDAVLHSNFASPSLVADFSGLLIPPGFQVGVWIDRALFNAGISGNSGQLQAMRLSL